MTFRKNNFCLRYTVCYLSEWTIVRMFPATYYFGKTKEYVSDNFAEGRRESGGNYTSRNTYFAARLSVRNVNCWTLLFWSGFITELHADTPANLPGSFVFIHPFRQLMKARAAFNSAPGIVFNVYLRADCNQLSRCAWVIFSNVRGTYVTQRNETLKSSLVHPNPCRPAEPSRR